MEVEILTQKLKKGLQSIERITRKNTSLAILSNVLLKTEKNYLKLLGTNLETSIEWSILAKIEKEGTVAIGANFLTSLINLIEQEKLKLKEVNNSLLIEQKKEKQIIRGINPAEFPLFPKIEGKEVIKLKKSEIQRGLIETIDIPSFSQIRPEISGIYFKVNKQNIKIVATDSFRLVESSILLTEKIGNVYEFILPQNSARELLNILSQLEGELTLIVDPHQVLFEVKPIEISDPNVKFLSRVIEGKFPDYQEILPKKFILEAIIDKEVLENKIKKAGIFSGRSSEVKLSFLKDKNIIKVFSKSSEVGEMESEILARIVGEKGVDIAFNYKFLLDGIKIIRSSEISFKISSEEGPVILEPIGEKNIFYVLMPIKQI